MRNNTLVNNIVNFGIGSSSVSDFYCDIDTSNTINGNPIYYYIEAHDMVFDESMEIGFLGLISCQNISVKNLHFTHNFEGMLLAGTVHSSVENCSFTNNEGHGLYLISSMENIVKNCTFRNGYFDGILLFDSYYNMVENCSSYDSYAGVRLEGSIHNMILRQTVDQCTVGILFDAAGNNTVKESELFHCGLHVIGNIPAEHINDVDTTNLVNGRPIYPLRRRPGDPRIK
jgi:parallel beta-helix repeat protein